MSNPIKNSNAVIQHWLDSAEKNKETMLNLFESKDYSWALFIGHLVLEKTIKALYVKKFNQHALFTHDLLRLAKKTELSLTDEYEEWLDVITTFNLNARYDNYKQEFYKLCTKEFSLVWLDRIEEIRLWLRNQF